MEISVVRGDLAAQSVDALVYGAGTNLEMDGAVASTLRRNAGTSLAEETLAEGPIGLGQVAVTDAGELDAEYVIHAAALPDHGRGEPSAASVRAATKNALRRADALDCESLATTVIGARTATFDFKEGARIICETIYEYDPESLDTVRIVVSDEPAADYVARIADATRSR